MDWGLAGKAPAVPHPPPPFLSSDMRQPTYKIRGWLRISVAASGGLNTKKQSGMAVFVSLPLQRRVGRSGTRECQKTYPWGAIWEFIFDDPKLPEASQPLEAMRRWSGRGMEGGEIGRAHV